MKLNNIMVMVSVSAVVMSGCTQQQSQSKPMVKSGMSPTVQASTAQKRYQSMFGKPGTSLTPNSVMARINKNDGTLGSGSDAGLTGLNADGSSTSGLDDLDGLNGSSLSGSGSGSGSGLGGSSSGLGGSGSGLGGSGSGSSASSRGLGGLGGNTDASSAYADAGRYGDALISAASKKGSASGGTSYGTGAYNGSSYRGTTSILPGGAGGARNAASLYKNGRGGAGANSRGGSSAYNARNGSNNGTSRFGTRGGSTGAGSAAAKAGRGAGRAGNGRDISGADMDNPKSLLTKKVIYFDYNSSNIRSSDYAILNAHAAFLKDYPDITVRLEGHADERGTREYNVALSEKRAQTVLWYLKGKGVNAKQMETIAYGEEKPAVQGEGERSWAKNRRVELNYYRY